MSQDNDGFERAIATIAATERLMVAVDFDGTLAPLVDDPESSRILPPARSAILDLAAVPKTSVVVISGRPLDVLDQLVDLPVTVALVGSHGAEFLIDGVRKGIELTAEERHALAVVAAVVSSVASRFEGVIFEEKPAGAGLHTRTASREDAAKAESECLRRLGMLQGGPDHHHLDPAADHVVEEGVTVRRGKNILEFSVRSADKGTALTFLREQLAATGVAFLGDDVTDEDAFAILGAKDLGIKVGEGDSLAQFRLADPSAVAAFLGKLVVARRSAMIS